MTHINIKISKAVATAEKDGIITTGMVGVPVSFMFDSLWDGLIVTAVFKGSGAPISVPLLGATETVVPWEVLKRPGQASHTDRFRPDHVADRKYE